MAASSLVLRCGVSRWKTGDSFGSNNYWSATENNSNNAWNFNSGNWNNNKTNNNYVRPLFAYRNNTILKKNQRCNNNK